MRLLSPNERRTPDASEPMMSERSGPVLFVVDDDLSTQELLREVGLEAGWDAHGFARVSELRAALEWRRPALLILDDDLPDGRGGDLAREFREDDRMAGVVILVCTAAHPMRQAEIGNWAPVVSKPFDLGEIEAFLTAVADRGDGRRSFDRAG
jgi:DNA-binding response OmpR family regulator